jgi:hypothetical protein
VDEQPGLSNDERAELQRLREEVADLRARRADASARRPVAEAGPARRPWWRAAVAGLLLGAGCLLAPLSVVAVWARSQVTDTDRYVRTVGPLASDPAIQAAVADRITAQVFASIDVNGLTTQAVDALAGRGLPPRLADPLRALAGPITSGVRSYTRAQVGDVVASPAFADAWIQANRLAHAELVKALTGEGGGAVTVEGDTVRVNLAPFVRVVKQRLVASGFDLAARVPETDVSFVLFQSDQVTRARGAFRLLDTLGVWLPVLALSLLALGVLAAGDRRRALAGAAAGVVIGMVVLALGLAVFRTTYLDAIPGRVLPHDAAAALYDTIVRFLRLELRTVLVLALVVAAGAFLTGPSLAATRTRHGLASAIGWVRGRTGPRRGSVGAWVQAGRPLLHGAAVALAAMALVFWPQPTGKVVLLLTGLLLVTLALVEFLGHSPGAAAPLEPRGPREQTLP